jgi:uncharacterized glyoxalase superfamily protein PhnB
MVSTELGFESSRERHDPGVAQVSAVRGTWRSRIENFAGQRSHTLSTLGVMRRTNQEEEETMPATTLQVRSLVPTLTVNDLKKSIQFYRDGLGFTVTEEMNDEGKLLGVMLEAGGFSMGLSQDDFSKGKDRVKGVGMRLYLETDQDLEALSRQAKAAGITPGEGLGPLPWGPLGFTVLDPDGFKLTFSNPA